MSMTVFAFCCAIILLITALILFTVAVIKQQKRIFLYSGLALLACVIPTGFIGYKIIKVLIPRTGMEAYEKSFGKPVKDCVKVTHFQDAEVPVMDFAMAFRFKTCPEELQRIVSQKEYKKEFISTKGLMAESIGVIGTDTWLSPQSLGDSAILYRYRQGNEGGSISIYSNTDMTEAFYIDIFK